MPGKRRVRGVAQEDVPPSFRRNSQQTGPPRRPPRRDLTQANKCLGNGKMFCAGVCTNTNGNTQHCELHAVGNQPGRAGKVEDMPPQLRQPRHQLRGAPFRSREQAVPLATQRPSPPTPGAHTNQPCPAFNGRPPLPPHPLAQAAPASTHAAPERTAAPAPSAASAAAKTCRAALTSAATPASTPACATLSRACRPAAQTARRSQPTP